MGQEKKKKSIAIVVSENSLDKAMMPMILATSGVALDAEVHVFFTFWGLLLLKKNYKPKLKGFMKPFTKMMIKKMKSQNIATFEELRAQCIELGVKFYACSTSMAMMNVKREELVDKVEIVGATKFMELAFKSDVTLFI